MLSDQGGTACQPVTMIYAVELPDHIHKPARCFLATWSNGDPPRTFSPEHARPYKTKSAAKAAITRALKTCPIRPRRMIVVPHPIQTP